MYLSSMDPSWGTAKHPMWDEHLSNEKNPGWLDNIGDYTTQLYRDFNKPL